MQLNGHLEGVAGGELSTAPGTVAPLLLACTATTQYQSTPTSTMPPPPTLQPTLPTRDHSPRTSHDTPARPSSRRY
jgi:hypothetical protein